MNALHLSAMFSREDVVKMLLNKKGVDICAPGGVSELIFLLNSKIDFIFPIFILQLKQQSAIHLVASRQTGTATSILRLLLNTAGKEIRLKPDGVRI